MYYCVNILMTKNVLLNHTYSCFYSHTELHNFIIQGCVVRYVDWFVRLWDWGDHEMGG